MRLSAHSATNYHRFVLVYILLEGVMSELFMLIALEGIMGRIQYISLGYNLSGVMSMIFETIESMQCLGEKMRCCLKRVLFNHETVMIGELVCAGAMQKYLTSLNRTSLKDTNPEATVASYYVRCRHGSFAVLTAPCCIDTIMGVRCKLIMLAGYVYENGKLYYSSRTLAAFGILRLVEEDGSEYLAFHKLNWISPTQELFVIGVVSKQRVAPCEERQCDGLVSMFDCRLGGNIGEDSHRRRIARNKVTAGPTTIDLPNTT